MAVIVTGKDQVFAEWAARRIPAIGTADNFGKYRAVGVATGFEAADKLMAVIVYHDYYDRFGHCQISVASASPRWVAKATIRALLAVPFLQYGCNKVWIGTPHTSKRVVGLAKALGFTQEAILKDHFGRGTHAVICRMMRPEYDRIYWPSEEKKAA